MAGARAHDGAGRHGRRGSHQATMLVLSLLLALVAAVLVSPPQVAHAECGGNAVVCENLLPGAPESVWDVDGAGDLSIQGFATKTSVNAGSRIDFKVDTKASAYTIKIYRLGWYQGNGAREVATIAPSVVRPQTSSCFTDSDTEIYDCGAWEVSASWDVPAAAVSGVYIARLIRTDTGGDSHIPFVVRNDGNRSAVVMQTSDTTWQAYNNWGGSEFYHGKSNGRAYKISYNRPYATRGTVNGRDFLFSNEYPMIRFLEQNGFDVSYVSGLDVDKDPTLLPKHKVFLSVGHDEYWSKNQRKNVTDARDAGVSLGFFGGNDVYWKSRWEPSQDGTSTADRTLVDYKDTWAGADIDPVEPTATWRDPRWGDLGYGFGPENALIGTQFQANSVDLAMKVSADEGKLRFWRGTTLASMGSGTTATLSDHTVGYESNEDVDNGYRPAGLIHLSTTTGSVPEYLVDYGVTVSPGTTTHTSTLYRASSGALVFSAGTIQWSWGLDSHHDGAATPADPRMRQATVNLLTDMGASATSLADDLTATSPSTDTTPPSVAITAPAAGSTVTAGSLITVSGTASDIGGRVAGVEVSVDGGATFHPADGREAWSYSGILTGNGPGAVQARATDDSVRTSTPVSLAITSPCPCTIFGAATPVRADGGDDSGVTLGVRFTSSAAGFVTGVRFYKAPANGGTHTGTLYSDSGAVLATGTFTGETASGWQTLAFPQSVPVTAGATYTAAYTAPNGHYSADLGYFDKARSAANLTALGGTNVVNGVYTTGAGMPTSTYKHTNYWVDPMWSATDDSPTLVVATTPGAGANSVPTASTVSASFNRGVDPAALMMQMTASDGTGIPGVVSYDAASRKATFNPNQGLAPGATYTVTVKAAEMGAPQQWTFTTAAADAAPNVCPCTLFNDSDQPTGGPDTSTRAVQLGMAFSSSSTGQITGIRFYKNPTNLGTHTVALWSSGGSKLAEATATSETSAGWQQAMFDTPVSVSAGSTYVASYLAPQGNFAYTASGLSAKVSKGPLSSLASGGRYSYGSGALTGTSSTNYFVDPVFISAPSTPPAVRMLSPGNQATSVPVDAHVQATFDSDVQPGSTVVKVTRDDDGTVVDGATSSESQGSVVSFVPAQNLDPGTRYDVVVSGARNLGGTAMTSAYSASFVTSGAGACPCSLMETSTQPALTDSGDSGGVTLGLRFTSSVSGFVKGLRYYRDEANTGTHTGSLWSDGGAKLATLTFTDGPPGWTTASFANGVAVTAGTTYVASYYAPNGHYSADLHGFDSPRVNTPLSSVGAGGVYVYRDAFPTSTYLDTNYYVDVVFSTADTDPASVVSTTPSADAKSVPTDTALTAVFARPIDASTLTFTVTDPAGQLVGGQLGYDSATRTATFSTAGPLAAGVRYAATVNASSAAGVAMPDPKSWSFTTTDPQPPVVSSTAPAAGSREVAKGSAVTATFSRPVDPATLVMTLANSASAATITGTTSWDAVTNTATFTPSSALADATAYTASISAKNVSGVAMTAAQTWTFTTADTVAPTVTTVTPSSGSTNVAAGTTVTATFARAVDPATVQVTLRTSAGGSVVGTTTYDAATLRATFAPSAPLASFTGYTATATAKNLSGVAMTSPRTWSFTTADTDAPTISARTPAAGATNVAAGTNVTATFARAVSTTGLGIAVRTADGRSVVGTSTYSSANRTLTFNPSSDLTSSTAYTVTVSATSSSGVPMSSPATWSFTTASQSFSLYTTSRVPSATVTTTTPTTVGVQFTSSRAGKATAIRYYATSTNTGRTVKLYNADGSIAGTATTNQTATGWRTATFSTPVAVAAGTAYTASYYAPAGRWSTTTGGYSSAYSAGPLSVAAGGGRTGNGDVFPTTASTTNFWVDVLVQI